jgi:uncharacterized protein
MPKITLIFTALHIFLMLFLAYRVVGHRRTARIGLGTNGDYMLERKVRVHANFVENVPLALLALALLELCGLAPLWLYVFGAMLFVGRILHAVGLSKKSGTSFGRFYGTLLTWIALVAMAATGLAIGIGAI